MSSVRPVSALALPSNAAGESTATPLTVAEAEAEATGEAGEALVTVSAGLVSEVVVSVSASEPRDSLPMALKPGSLQGEKGPPAKAMACICGGVCVRALDSRCNTPTFPISDPRASAYPEKDVDFCWSREVREIPSVLRPGHGYRACRA